MSRSPHVVVGGSVAALVTADALAAAGSPVELYLPDRGIGGGFLPMERGGRRLDLGPRVLELHYDTSASPAPPWSAYRPGPHGHRPFLTAIENLVRDLAGTDLFEVRPAEVSVAGQRCTDYVLAGDLSGLTDAVERSVLEAMAAEIDVCIQAVGSEGVFAAGSAGVPWDRTFDDVARAQTGTTFHELLIAPLADKILEGGASRVAAALHRKVWLPLFHPRTAWEACRGELTYRPQRPFLSVTGGGMGEVVRRLLQRVTDSPQVSAHTEGSLVGIVAASDGVSLSFSGGAKLTTAEPVLGVGAAELFSAAGVNYVVDQVPVAMVWIDLPESDVAPLPCTLFAAEPHIPVLRVTENLADHRPGRRTVCCEVAQSVAVDQRESVALAALVDLGLTDAPERAEVVASAARPAFAVPSQENRLKFDAARSDLDRLDLGMAIVGGASVFAADSFNEQVAQGLAEADRRLG